VSNELKKIKNIIMLTHNILLHIQKEFQIEASFQESTGNIPMLTLGRTALPGT